ncbi:MAG: hypothetical protein R2875_14045 [Desulfobacterales bacterium]
MVIENHMKNNICPTGQGKFWCKIAGVPIILMRPPAPSRVMEDASKDIVAVSIEFKNNPIISILFCL